jgi:hypothetical protein
MNSALIATNLLLGLLDRAAAIGSLLALAQAEGRDITAAELDTVFEADAAARAQLQSAIDAAKAGQGSLLGES